MQIPSGVRCTGRHMANCLPLRLKQRSSGEMQHRPPSTHELYVLEHMPGNQGGGDGADGGGGGLKQP